MIVYLANEDPASMDATLSLAEEHGVIVTNVFRGPSKKDAEKEPHQGAGWSTNNGIGELREGDTIILAYRAGGSIVEIRALAMIAAQYNSDVERFGRFEHYRSPLPAVLGQVAAKELEVEIQQAGYSRDKRIGSYCVICVAASDGDAVECETFLAQLNDWYQGLPNKQTTIHVYEDGESDKIGAADRRDNSVTAAAQPPLVENVAERMGSHPNGITIGIGVDFSGAANPTRTMWRAKVRCENGIVTVDELTNGFTHAQLVVWLHQPNQKGIILIDFPFGLASHTALNIGAYVAGAPLALWQCVAGFGTPDAFREAARNGHWGPGTEVPHRRAIDQQFHTPFCPINLRLYRQTYRGIVNVLSPMHHQEVPIYPWGYNDGQAAEKWVGEGCPSSSLMVRNLPRVGYKGPGANRRASRLLILQGLNVQVGIFHNQILDDTGGDALDAVVLAVAACQMGAAQLQAGLQHLALHPTEGFIYV
jgi:hypothetical protein